MLIQREIALVRPEIGDGDALVVVRASLVHYCARAPDRCAAALHFEVVAYGCCDGLGLGGHVVRVLIAFRFRSWLVIELRVIVLSRANVRMFVSSATNCDYV